MRIRSFSILLGICLYRIFLNSGLAVETIDCAKIERGQTPCKTVESPHNVRVPPAALPIIVPPVAPSIVPASQAAPVRTNPPKTPISTGLSGTLPPPVETKHDERQIENRRDTTPTATPTSTPAARLPDPSLDRNGETRAKDESVKRDSGQHDDPRNDRAPLNNNSGVARTPNAHVPPTPAPTSPPTPPMRLQAPPPQPTTLQERSMAPAAPAFPARAIVPSFTPPPPPPAFTPRPIVMQPLPPRPTAPVAPDNEANRNAPAAPNPARLENTAATGTALPFALPSATPIPANAPSSGTTITPASVLVSSASLPSKTKPVPYEAGQLVIYWSDAGDAAFGATVMAHGNALAMLIAGHDAPHDFVGISPAANLHIASIMRLQGGETASNTATLVRALDWLMGERVQIINLSLGGAGDRIMEEVIARVLRSRIIIVAAAGNQGEDAQPSYPAAYPGVIAVTASDARDRIFDQANRGAYITLAAPGVDVWIPDTQTGHYVSGTSFSAAIVSGAVALMLAQQASLDNSSTRAALCAHAIDLGKAGVDSVFGCGLIQIEPTLTQLAQRK